MTSTNISVSKKNEQQYWHNHTHHTHTAVSQTHVSSACSRRVFNNNRYSSMCGIRCISLSACEQEFRYLNDSNTTIGDSICRNGFDDSSNFYLPPPSPAPNSDRYVIGVMPFQNVQVCSGATNAHRIGIYSSHYADDSKGFDHTRQDSLHQHEHTQQSNSCLSVSSSQLSENGIFYKNLPQKYVNAMQRCTETPNKQFGLSERLREMSGPKTLTLHNSSDIISNQHVSTPSTGESIKDSSTADRYVHSEKFSTQNTSLMTRNTYTYLTSAVHAPVKRYVPTPPVDLYMHNCDIGGTNINYDPTNNFVIEKVTTQNINTLPYPFRMNCCKEGISNTNMIIKPANSNTSNSANNFDARSPSVTDYWGTSPRKYSKFRNSSHDIKPGTTRSGANNDSTSVNFKCTTMTGKDSSIIIIHDQHMRPPGSKHSETASCMSSTVSVTGYSSLPSLSSGESSIMTGPANNVQNRSVFGASSLITTSTSSIHPNNKHFIINDYVKYSPNPEYINTLIVKHGERENYKGNTVANNSVTCLHCNTVRRTTGVHQTTQTTGPISPTPIQRVIESSNNNPISIPNCKGSFLQKTINKTTFTLTHSTSDSLIAPMPPSGSATPNDSYAHITLPSKINDRSRINFVIEQTQKQRQADQVFAMSQKSQQLQKHVITQGTITKQIEILENSLCNISGSSECQHLRSTPIHPSQQSIFKQSPISPVQKLDIQVHQQQHPEIENVTRKKRFIQYCRKEISHFFGVDVTTEAEQVFLWEGRQRRLALRRFGGLKSESDSHSETNSSNCNKENIFINCNGVSDTINQRIHQHNQNSKRPDILPSHDTEEDEPATRNSFLLTDLNLNGHAEHKMSVAAMVMSTITFIIGTLNKREIPPCGNQWSRNFPSTHMNNLNKDDNASNFVEDIAKLQENEVFFDPNDNVQTATIGASKVPFSKSLITKAYIKRNTGETDIKLIEPHSNIYMAERVHSWSSSAVLATNTHSTDAAQLQTTSSSNKNIMQQHQRNNVSTHPSCLNSLNLNIIDKAGEHDQTTPSHAQSINRNTSNRISSQLIDETLENSHSLSFAKVKLISVNNMSDRDDHRPFFTYWINTVQILVLLLTIVCYGIGPIGVGVEQKIGQVLVTSLSLQTVRHAEQRNIWIGPRNKDLVHLGAKFATCMRNDVRVINVLLKTRRQERESACCIRNDDSGCVQSSQADCIQRGLFPTKSISIWKKWSAGEAGPGGRVSGSVCGLDPKYCDAPASISPYEWPDDITKWPICRKTNSFPQRFRYKDQTAEHMVCEVIGHPCCTGIYGECRITTREYCDFVNGYFHEEASLCSQISCLNNVCGMLPFVSMEIPDQIYRLFTSLCLHAGVLHLALTITFQYVFLADLERLVGPLRTAIIYIGSGLAGNLTSAVFAPYNPEVGPLASLSGVTASFAVLLILIHWKQLYKPYVALFKLLCITTFLFGIGTMPWQQSFVGLIMGIFCGIFLTIALVPFVSIAKYRRRAKVKLIWACLLFHFFLYSVLLITFLVLPTELTVVNTSKVLSTNFNPNQPSSADKGVPNST